MNKWMGLVIEIRTISTETRGKAEDMDPDTSRSVDVESYEVQYE